MGAVVAGAAVVGGDVTALDVAGGAVVRGALDVVDAGAEVVGDVEPVVVGRGEADERPGSVSATATDNTPADARAPRPSQAVLRESRARPWSRSSSDRTCSTMGNQPPEPAQRKVKLWPICVDRRLAPSGRTAGRPAPGPVDGRRRANPVHSRKARPHRDRRNEHLRVLTVHPLWRPVRLARENAEISYLAVQSPSRPTTLARVDAFERRPTSLARIDP